MEGYDSLLERVRKRDEAAAAQLEPLARAQHDETVVLACWRLLTPGRARAWQALRALFNSLGPMPDTADPRDSGETATVQRALIAQLLVERCRANASGDALEELMLEVSEIIFKTPLTAAAKIRVGEGLDRIPIAPDLETSIRVLKRIHEALKAFMEASDAPVT